jgi:O-antigen ligase
VFKFLLFFSFYLPIGIALNPSRGVDLSSVRVLIIGFFLFWVSEGLKRRKIAIRADLSTALVVIFLFLSVFSAFWSRNTDWSLRKLAFLFSIFPIYFIASWLVDSREKMEKVIKALVLGGLVVSAIAIFEFFLQFILGIDRTYQFWAKHVTPIFLGESFSEAVLRNPSWLVNISGHTYLRAIGLFPDPHMFSFFLGILIPLALGLSMKLKSKQYLFVFFVLLLADFLTFSRGGYLGLFFGAAFLTIFFWGRIGKRYKVVSAAITIGIAGILLVPNPVSVRLLSSFNLKEGSNEGRLEMWEKASDVTRDHPLFGVGIGNYPLTVKPTAGYREPIYAHNTYLDISSETGIINALAWISLLILSIVAFIRKSREDFLYLFLAAGLLIFSVHSVFETGIYSPAVLSLVLIVFSFNGFNELDDEKNS